MRYTEILKIVRDLKPEHAIEVGTWNGKRGVEMMAVSNCYYSGFDLFDEGTKKLDKAEFNVKDHTSLVEVAKQIEQVGFSKFALYRGNSRKTLPLWLEKLPPFQFAFIDGGHSVETIASDFKHIYDNIDEGGTIILDDYYEPEIKGFGCNQVIKDVEHEILPPQDQHGGTNVNLVRVVK